MFGGAGIRKKYSGVGSIFSNEKKQHPIIIPSLMDQITNQAGKKLQEIFRKSGVADLPALSENVQELLYLTSNPRTTAAELADVILKDYSLTNKILQVVNSAYYSPRVPVSSIARAVTVLGFSAIRELATAIAVFEDFIKAGADKDTISKLLTKSILSAIFAKQICDKKKLNIACDEAFICAMFYNLGKIVVTIWMPGHYRKIEEHIARGLSEKSATMVVLSDLTYQVIGMAMLSFWNFSDQVVSAMNDEPPRPTDAYDAQGYLQNIAVFCNTFVDKIAKVDDINVLMEKNEGIFYLSKEEAIAILLDCVVAAENISKIYQYGLAKLKIKSKLLNAK